MVRIRAARMQDRNALIELRSALWPDTSREEHEREIDAILEGTPPGPMPLDVLLACGHDDRPVGFVEVGLRSHADGCDRSRPCGYVEGWYVIPEARGLGVGKALIAEAERWARNRGCVELASDTWIDNEDSQKAHEALGFEVVDRCVTYRKTIAAEFPIGRKEEP